MTIKNLYNTLHERKRPEDVAQIIEQLIGNDLSNSELKTLKKASRNSLKNKWLKYTSMLQYFAEPIGVKKQITKAIELFEVSFDMDAFNYKNADDVEMFIKKVSPIIGKEFGKNNMITDRMSKEQRKEAGFDISKRRYNKLFRMLKRLELKLQKLIREQKKIEFQKISKHKLAHTISFDLFTQDIYTACFIAYYVARCNLRSEFTILGQKKPYDNIADMLFKKATKGTNANPNYLAMAYVYTDPKILNNLSDEQKGEFLGKWTSVLQDISELLEDVWSKNTFNKETMIVKKGDDSTTWNNTAGAWNKARDAWINIVYALGMEFILDSMCFGKVMRLMAADVAYWHRSVGNTLDPNTIVWNKLPLPWEVFNEKRRCTKSMVVNACKEANLNPSKTGWMAPRPHGIEKFTPTPELVHGVTVSNPVLAKVLKKHKFYSGKKAKPFIPLLN